MNLFLSLHHPIFNVNADKYMDKESEQLSPLQSEKNYQMKLQTAKNKSALSRTVDEIEMQVKKMESKLTETDDRLTLLKLQKQINMAQKEFMKKQIYSFLKKCSLI